MSPQWVVPPEARSREKTHKITLCGGQTRWNALIIKMSFVRTRRGLLELIREFMPRRATRGKSAATLSTRTPITYCFFLVPFNSDADRAPTRGPEMSCEMSNLFYILQITLFLPLLSGCSFVMLMPPGLHLIKRATERAVMREALLPPFPLFPKEPRQVHVALQKPPQTMLIFGTKSHLNFCGALLTVHKVVRTLSYTDTHTRRTGKGVPPGTDDRPK